MVYLLKLFLDKTERHDHKISAKKSKRKTGFVGSEHFQIVYKTHRIERATRAHEKSMTLDEKKLEQFVFHVVDEGRARAEDLNPKRSDGAQLSQQLTHGHQGTRRHSVQRQRAPVSQKDSTCGGIRRS